MKLIITYTNGKKWHQPHVAAWIVSKNKSGGYDIYYIYEKTFSVNDKTSCLKKCNVSTEYKSLSGDIAHVTEIETSRVTGIKKETTSYYQPVKKDVWQ